jgi:hypothetical protein
VYIFRKGPVDLGAEEVVEVEQTLGYDKLLKFFTSPKGDNAFYLHVFWQGTVAITKSI